MPINGKTQRPYRYERAKDWLRTALDDLRILAGDKVGNGATWQDVAGTCAVNLRCLADALESARLGYVVDGPVVFPSPEDL